MMKSYQESGGTTLSTNWDEVKKAPVEVKPPAGKRVEEMELISVEQSRFSHVHFVVQIVVFFSGS